jgi:hypothetical protein
MSFRIKKTSDEEKTKQSQPQANKIEKFYTQEEIDLIGIKYENPQTEQPMMYKKKESETLTSQNIIYDTTTKMWKFSS